MHYHIALLALRVNDRLRNSLSLCYVTDIRRWTYFVSDQLLVYDIGKFRWCSNVGRFHKSNNIM